MITRSNDSIPSWQASAILGLTIVAPFLGGSVQLWAIAILGIGAGVIMLVCPARKSLGAIPNCLFVGLLVIALTAFLPASWFWLPDWRIELTKLGAELPSTRSPQPWLTLQWTAFLFLALAWGYYLSAVQWGRHLRETVYRAFVFAILLLSTVLIFGFVTKMRIPFWPDGADFGFFPNRNQTSNVLGIGAIAIYGLALQRFQEGRQFWWFWLVSLSLVCWALIIDGSRAGIILFFFGALAVHIYWWSASRDRRQTAVAFGGLILLIALFIVDGGATLLRFTKESAGFFETDQNLRFAICRDAVPLILKSSPLGIGLGNFWPVFALYRHYSFSTSQTAHPESDWLWAAIDLGWLGVIVAIALFCWWLSQCPPFTAGTNRLLRVAAMVCGIGFAIHGLLDVSGHRLGSLMPALFLASIAIDPRKMYRESRLVPIIFRLIGVLLIAFGAWWLGSMRFRTLPTTATVERLRVEVNRAIVSNDIQRAKKLSSQALNISPLDWMFYYKRGVAEAASFDSRSVILRDFAISRYLLRNWPELYLRQGEVLLGVAEPDLAFDIWEEGMRKLPQTANSLYSDIFGLVSSDPDLRDRWRELAEDDKNRVLVFLGVANETEFQLEIQQLLAADDQLRAFNDQDLKRLFAIWYQKGDKLWLADTLRQHPAWRKLAWPQLAHCFADYQDYRQAFETASQFIAEASSPDQRLVEARLWADEKEWKRAWQTIQPLVPSP